METVVWVYVIERGLVRWYRVGAGGGETGEEKERMEKERHHKGI